MKIKKCVRILLVIILTFILFLGILTVLTPFILLANEGLFLKAQLDNMYIEKEYKGWNVTEINNWGSCLLPNEWIVMEDNGVIYINDIAGNIIAKGTILEACDSVFVSQELFLSEILNHSVNEITYDYVTTFVRIDDSLLGTISVNGENETKCGFARLKKYDSPELFVVFQPDIAVDSPEVVDLVQAIAFSYHFPEQALQGYKTGDGSLS